MQIDTEKKRENEKRWRRTKRREEQNWLVVKD